MVLIIAKLMIKTSQYTKTFHLHQSLKKKNEKEKSYLELVKSLCVSGLEAPRFFEDET